VLLANTPKKKKVRVQEGSERKGASKKGPGGQRLARSNFSNLRRYYKRAIKTIGRWEKEVQKGKAQL